MACRDYRPDHNGECLTCDEDAAAHEEPMSDEQKDDTASGPLDLANYLLGLGEPFSFEAMTALRRDITAGTVTLTDREKQILALAGMIILHSASEHAARMFTRELANAGAGIARLLAVRLPDPDDDPDEPQGKPS